MRRRGVNDCGGWVFIETVKTEVKRRNYPWRFGLELIYLLDRRDVREYHNGTVEQSSSRSSGFRKLRIISLEDCKVEASGSETSEFQMNAYFR